jgi:hypothetical protein
MTKLQQLCWEMSVWHKQDLAANQGLRPTLNECHRQVGSTLASYMGVKGSNPSWFPNSLPVDQLIISRCVAGATDSIIKR